MSKIVRAVNTMIVNRDLITKIIEVEKEYFFLYKQKYKWSILPDTKDPEVENYSLIYYKDDRAIEHLSHLEGPEWESVLYVGYYTRDLKSKEARESFQELYRTVKEKLYNIDEVLDDIIGEDEDEVPF